MRENRKVDFDRGLWNKWLARLNADNADERLSAGISEMRSILEHRYQALAEISTLVRHYERPTR